MRKCGECTLCCTIDAVTELRKPSNFTCWHCTGTGCRIYQQRPQSCRNYACEWLRGELPRWMRPDKVHMLVERMAGTDEVVLAIADPKHIGRWRTERIDHALITRYQERGVAVACPEGLTMIPPGRTIEQVRSAVKAGSDHLSNIMRMGGSL